MLLIIDCKDHLVQKNQPRSPNKSNHLKGTSEEKASFIDKGEINGSIVQIEEPNKPQVCNICWLSIQ